MSDRFDIVALHKALDNKRRMLGLTWKQAAAEAVISNSTFSRMGVQKLSPTAENLARMLLWLGDTDLKPYLRPVDTQATNPSQVITRRKKIANA